LRRLPALETARPGSVSLAISSVSESDTQCHWIANPAKPIKPQNLGGGRVNYFFSASRTRLAPDMRCSILFSIACDGTRCVDRLVVVDDEVGHCTRTVALEMKPLRWEENGFVGSGSFFGR